METINLKSQKLDFDGVDSEQGMKLLSIYWNRQHHIGPIVYRTAFMRDMACNGSRFSKLLLNAMYFSASEYLSRAAASSLDGSVAARCAAADNCSEGMTFRRRAEALLHAADAQLLLKSDLTTVQALLIMSHTLFSWCDEKSASWHYAGMAISMIIDLGLHNEAGRRPDISSPYQIEDKEIYRRVFWAAFAIDKLQSVYQGRPPRLREADNCVPILFLDEYDELDPFHTDGYALEPEQLGYPSHVVSTFEQLCKLSIIIDCMISNLYTEKSSRKSPTELLRITRSLDEDLTAWRHALPSHLSALLELPNKAIYLPHTISLMSLFNAVIILLYRPLVSDSHLQTADEAIASKSFARCAAAATDIDSLLRQYQKSFCVKSAPYTLSYATYVSATIHLRIAAQHRAGSAAHIRLQNCLEILSEHQVVSHASRRCLRILNDLVKRLDVNVLLGPELAQARNTDISTLSNAVRLTGDVDRYTQMDTTSSQQIMQANGNEMTGITPGLENTWSDLDMDEIIRTFTWDAGAMDTTFNPNNLDAGGIASCTGLSASAQDRAESSYFDALFGVDL
ncbi:uncharacterized protein HMPREF1541_06004 [Cyphellophora europaea CBS 101466]|uniref:Xylanolytic transcriptional activator regulatory domain-containing protein n=1 Tax=Cyphellophora europaea (strain CBS 101466) TaxID=1220924 RepID=W2RVH9_CYPE1|nr:uncharacterized protein HMPREF1541_06004 [Cyphellophora europaea CBS 101466]ETN39778.1 hypothetical protein HMPREF1541_06004 [Cyphellophora europaea CBS 101466]